MALGIKSINKEIFIHLIVDGKHKSLRLAQRLYRQWGFLLFKFPPHQIFHPKSKKFLDNILKLLYNILIMKKQKRQNLVAKYARKVCKAVRMRDKSKYSRFEKHKVKYQDNDNT